MGTNSARLGLSLRGGGGAAGALQDEDGGPRASSGGAAEAESGAASSPSEGDTRGLRFWVGRERRAWPPDPDRRGGVTLTHPTPLTSANIHIIAEKKPP